MPKNDKKIRMFDGCSKSYDELQIPVTDEPARLPLPAPETEQFGAQLLLRQRLMAVRSAPSLVRRPNIR